MDTTTARPWHAADYPDGRIEITGNHRTLPSRCEATDCVAEITRNGFVGRANALLIVESVNAYDGLRAEVAKLRSALERIQGLTRHRGYPHVTLDGIQGEAIAALTETA